MKDVEFALKYTQSWGFHVEMEILIAGTDDKAEAAERIKKVAEGLDLDVMSDEQLSAFTQKIDDGWNRGAYSKETFRLSV